MVQEFCGQDWPQYIEILNEVDSDFNFSIKRAYYVVVVGQWVTVQEKRWRQSSKSLSRK